MMAHKHFPSFRLRALTAALASCFASSVVIALPTGGNVVNGTATITQNGNVLTITNTSGTIINWQGFSIGKGETTRFIQPDSVSTVLNRVVTNDPSVLLGSLVSNGQVFLVNPAGILVGKGAHIDVGAFVASTLQISDADFLARRFNFVETPGAGKLINRGTISTPSGGSVYLVAPDVENAGLITSPSGEVILAAGQSVQIGDTATPGVRAEVTGAGSATNVGHIVASAGQIGLVGALVKNAGNLNASSAVSEGGRIYLRASDKVVQTGKGKMDASGTRGGSILAQSDDMTLLDGSVMAVGHGDEGGEVSALGDRVGIIGHAKVDVSGKTGGGTILVGGDYQGNNTAVQNADFTYVGANTTLRADARARGDGGKVIVWANDSARVHGRIYARGGGRNGDGGFVETSGKQFLDVAGVRVRTDGAAFGAAGNWLLDPDNLKIIHATSAGSDSGLVASGNYFYPDTMVGGTYSTISDYTINQAIAGNSTVTLYAQNDMIFDGTAAGAVVITKQASDTFSTTLGLSAGQDIRFRGDTVFQTLGGTGTGALLVTLSPGSGTSTIESGASLTLQGAAASVGLVVGSGSQRTLENYGTFNVTNNAYVDLESAGYYSSFVNQATGMVNVATNAASDFPFRSDTMDGGSVTNHGIWNADLTNGSQSYEVLFINDDTGATLNVSNGGGSRYLSLQNADRLASDINIGSGSTLWLSEMHSNTSSNGGWVYLDHATITGPGILKVGGGSYSVTAKIDGTSFNSGLKLWEGASTGYLAFDSDQSQLNGSSIYSSNNNLTVPDTGRLALSGDVGFYTTGDLSIANQSTGGKLYLLAGWNGSSFTLTPGVSGTGSISVTGAVSAGGALWARATQDIRVDASDGNASLTSGGASQSLQAGNDILVQGGAGRALLRYSGSGTQTVVADKIRVEGGASVNNSWAKLQSAGAQDLSATTSIVVQAGGDASGGYGNFAAIEASGNQLLTAPGILVAGGDGGSTGYLNYAAIRQNSSSGTQKIVITGSDGLILTGGSGYGTHASSSSDCTGCLVSDNDARIYNRGSGGQEIDFRASGAELRLVGGANGSQNTASMENEGSGLQKIWSSTSTRPDIVIKGGTSGGTYNVAHNQNLGNDASISSDGDQFIRANNLTIDGGYLAAASPNYVSGAFLVGADQDIDLTGNLSMLAGGSNIAGQYGMGASAVIGNDNGANVKLVVGGNLTMLGHGIYSGAFIGAAQGNATIEIQAGDMSIGSYSMLGNLDPTATAGSIELTATSGAISLLGSSTKMRTASLVAEATGNVDLYGSNEIQHVDLTSSGGGVNLHTSNATTHLDSILAESGSVAVTNASGNLSVGTIEAGGLVELTANKAILDGNGSSVNITAPSVSLTSQLGGTSTGLAISSDVSASSVSAVVGSGGTANYGGVRLVSQGGPLSSLSITDAATSGGDIFFQQTGDFSTNANYSVSSSSGSILFATDGAMNLVGMASFSAPLGMTFVAGTDLTLGSLSFSQKASFAATGDITVNGMVFGSELGAVAGGDLKVNSGGKLYASDKLAFAASNVRMDGGIIETGTGNIVGLISQDMILNNGSLVSAGDDVHLSFAGASSKLVLNETNLMSPSYIRADVYTGVAATIYLDFAGQSSGGVVVDGADGFGSGSSGFYAAGSPAVAGTGLVVTYGATTGGGEFIKDVLSTTPPQTDSGLLNGVGGNTGNLTLGGTTGSGDNEFGGGSTTGENNEGRNRNRGRGGMCRG